MITLCQFSAAFNVPNLSPYCLKVETFLRLCGLDYQVKTLFDPRKGPKGKLPFIQFGDELIADSAAYGILANRDTPLGRLAREFPVLVAYCERLRDTYWT